ncbi:MAG: hypothetical protein ACE5FQ_04475 [Thiogranum sp.]
MTVHPADPGKGFTLGMGNGYQDFFIRDTALYVWAVRDGDVAMVPDGDLNADGQIDASDVLIGLRIPVRGVIATREQLQHGDVAPLIGGEPSPNGVIGIGDILSIQRKALGLVSFP